MNNSAGATENYDSRVDDYIAKLPAWQQDICETVRKLVHQADPDIQETIKFTNRPYFCLHGNICALLSTEDHLNVFIYDPVAPDPQGLINQGQGNATARTIQLYQDQPLNEPAFVELIRAVATSNRAGGWRHLQR